MNPYDFDNETQRIWQKEEQQEQKQEQQQQEQPQQEEQQEKQQEEQEQQEEQQQEEQQEKQQEEQEQQEEQQEDEQEQEDDEILHGAAKKSSKTTASKKSTSKSTSKIDINHNCRDVIENIFKDYDLSDGILQNYNQMIDQLQTIISNFQFSKTYKDKTGRNTSITLIIDDYKIVPQEDLYIHYLQSRLKDYFFQIYFDITYRISQVDAQSKQEKKVDIPIKKTFNLIVPILTGCAQDPIFKIKSDAQLWHKGIDLLPTKCDILLGGVSYYVQNIYSYPNNKPTIVRTDKNNIVATAQFLKQDDVIFGNTYYSRIGLWQNPKNSSEQMFVLIFKQFDPRFKEAYIPIKWLFYLYGVKNDKQVLNMINNKDFQYFLFQTFRLNALKMLEIQHSKLDMSEYDEQDQQFFKRLQDPDELVLSLIRNTKETTIQDLKQAFDKYIFRFENSQQYVYQLLETIQSMWYAYKNNAWTDRDDLRNKRVQTMGIQFIGQMRSCLYQAWIITSKAIIQQLKDIPFISLQTKQEGLKEATVKMSEIFNHNIIKSISSATDKNLTPLQKSLNEFRNREALISLKRQIVLRLDSMGGKISFDQRKVQQSYYGFVCPITSPEGEVGRYMSPGIYTIFSNAYNIEPYVKFVNSLKQVSQNVSAFKDGLFVPLKINYIVYGFVAYADFMTVYTKLMKFRTEHYDLHQTSVYFQIENEQRNPIVEIGILTDLGRLMTPVYRKFAKDKTVKYNTKTSFTDKIKSGEIIYLCPEMMQNFIVYEWQWSEEQPAFQKVEPMKDPITGELVEYYFLPYGLIGELPCCSPFVHLSKSIRQSYSTNQIKANISTMYSNTQNMFVNKINRLARPQQESISTSIKKYIPEFNRYCFGQLMYVIFKPDTYNQEDALIGNLGYFNRGGAHSSTYITYQTSIENPSQGFSFKEGRTLRERLGLPQIGSQTRQGQILIHKFEKDIFGNEMNASIINDIPNLCLYQIVSNIRINDQHGNLIPFSLNMTDAKNPLVKQINSGEIKITEIFVRIQSYRQPSQGDKFISRNAQKGTIGIIRQEYDLDILQDTGISPTFTFSTVNAVMKRETYGQIAEPAMNKWLVKNKHYRISMGIEERNVQLLKELADIQPDIMVQHLSGQPLLQSSIFNGPMNYFVQMHLVDGKIYSRDFGPISKTTRQALKGRKHGGGMNHGNLEQQDHIVAGALNFIKDTHNTNSNWYICPHCGQSSVYKLNAQKIAAQGASAQATQIASAAVSLGAQGVNYVCVNCGQVQNPIIMGNSFMPITLQQVLYGSGVGIVYDVNAVKAALK